MKFIYCIASLLFIILSSLPVYAQYTLAGRVTDEKEKAPLPGAHVYIPALQKGTSTDHEGNFSISVANKGAIKLQVSLVGYESSLFTIPASTTAPLEITLKESLVHINEVVVSGGYTVKQEDSPIQIEVMHARELKQSGSPTLMEALTVLPGVEQISLGNGIGKPVIRGLSFSRVLTIYQGARFENQQWGADHGLGLTDTGLDRVEIIKGPASLMYGSGAVGGVINLIDENIFSSRPVEGDATISTFSNTLGLKSDVGLRGALGKTSSWSLRTGTESHADYIDGSGRTIGNSRFNSKNIKLGLATQKDWGSSKLTYTFRQQHMGIIEEDELTSTLATTRNDRSMQLPFQHIRDHFFSLQNNILVGSGTLALNMALHSNQREEIEDDMDEIDLGLNLTTLTYDLRYTPANKGAFQFTTGVQGFRQSNRNYPQAHEILIPNALLYDQSLYQMLYYQARRLTIQTGLRYDYRVTNATSQGLENYSLPGDPNENAIRNQFGGFSGSLGATYHVSRSTLLRSNIATGFRAPDLAELYSNGEHPGTNRYELGNVNFGREQSTEIDLSILQKSAHFTIEASAFYNHISNYVFFSPTGQTMPDSDLSIWTFRQEDVVLKGGEAGIAWHPAALSKLTGKTTFSFVHATSQEGKQPLPRIPAPRATYELKYRFGNLGPAKGLYVRSRWQQVMAQNRVSSDEDPTPGYHLLYAGIGSNFSLGKLILTADINANNLLNRQYVDHLSLMRPFGITMPGRNVSIQFSVLF
jgi:iron complex outermembrane recepter protein